MSLRLYTITPSPFSKARIYFYRAVGRSENLEGAVVM
jgi:hypothetical protein